MKLAKILRRFKAQFGDETLSKTQAYDWSKSFKEDWTRVENMTRLQLLQGKLWPALSGTVKASYSSIFKQSTKPPTQLIIRNFLKTD
jgi:hypothetical protein